MRGSVLFSFAFLLGVCQSAIAQDVVSASSGVLDYFEGSVTLDGKPVEHKAAVFPSLKNGSTIHTGKGRAELLLTPGVYLRMDENSELRMASNSLTDTRLEVKEGSAILDNLNASGSPVALLVQGSAVHFPKPGIYRINCDIGELQVYSGEAEVTHEKASVTVDPSHLYYFALSMTIDKFGEEFTDEFYDWAHNRSDVIADQNQRASAEEDDAQDPDPGSIPGLLGGAPSFPPPGYSTPPPSIFGSQGYGSYINPLYSYSSTPFLGYPWSPGIIIVTPFRHSTTATRWPGSAGVGYRPTPIVTRWPLPRHIGPSYPSRITSGSILRYPVGSTYRPGGTIPVRPGYTPMPRLSSPSIGAHPAAAPHVAAPHVGVVGHR